MPPETFPTPAFRSSRLALGFSPTRPAFEYFSVDSLGGGALDHNPVMTLQPDPVQVRLEEGEGGWRYMPLFETPSKEPLWTAEPSANRLALRSNYAPTPPAPPGLELNVDFTLTFRQKACHATLLGRMTPDEPLMQLPCVLHLPDMGSVRISANVPGLKLGYSAQRYVDAPLVRFVHIVFPSATKEHPVVEYTLEVAAIHPDLQGIEDEPAFDPFRRNFLNMLQVIPRRQMLGTNASSDICPFTLFMFAEAARSRVELAPGLYTWDLVRMTADRYLSGVKGYGQVGYEQPTGKHQFLDVDPSLILGSGIYTEASQDWDWARKQHATIMGLCRQMLASDTTGNGLIKYPTTGNYGDRPSREQRPANWWDTINFGHEDAYSNALAYQALETWGRIAEKLGEVEDARWLQDCAGKLRTAYRENFLNPETGVIAGWKSADGQLHDYWFLFVNSVAISYGVVDGALAHEIMDRLLRKLDEVGYKNFRLGLPGNLVPVKRGDYVDEGSGNPEQARLFGVPQLEDGSDGFPYYENGGASMRYALWTLRALYKLGRVEEARKMLYPMLDGYRDGEYQGFDANGVSNDWRTWDGKASGYEGFAVGNYLPLLAVIDEWNARAGQQQPASPAVKGATR